MQELRTIHFNDKTLAEGFVSELYNSGYPCSPVSYLKGQWIVFARISEEQESYYKLTRSFS